MVKRSYRIKKEPDQLSLLYKKLLKEGIIIQPVQIDTLEGPVLRYDIIDMWWDLSILFKSERYFPDQTKRMLTHRDAVMHSIKILGLIQKFYPRDKIDAKETTEKTRRPTETGTH